MARGFADIWTPDPLRKDIPNPEVIPDPWNAETAFEDFLKRAQDDLTSSLARGSSGKKRRSASSSIHSHRRKRRRLDDVSTCLYICPSHDSYTDIIRRPFRRKQTS